MSKIISSALSTVTDQRNPKQLYEQKMNIYKSVHGNKDVQHVYIIN